MNKADKALNPHDWKVRMTHVEATRQRRERATQMAALRNQGKTLQQVGDLCGVSRQRVDQLLKFARPVQVNR